MKLKNETRYRSADIERIVLAALDEAGITGHAREQVHVVYGRGFSGHCFLPGYSPPRKGERSHTRAEARMVLRVPRPSAAPFDDALFVWLVRHEVGHWRGLRHVQMHPEMRHRSLWLLQGRKLPPWGHEMHVATEDAEPRRPRAPVVDKDEVRAKRLAHAEAMLANARRKVKLATTIEKRWVRRVAAAARAIDKASDAREAAE